MPVQESSLRWLAAPNVVGQCPVKVVALPQTFPGNAT